MGAWAQASRQSLPGEQKWRQVWPSGAAGVSSELSLAACAFHREWPW